MLPARFHHLTTVALQGLYLAHLPLIIGVQILVRDWAFPAIIKWSVITLIITGFLLGIYETMVRYTWPGTLLNGSRRRKTT